MVHPLAVVNGLFPDDLESWRGPRRGIDRLVPVLCQRRAEGFIGGARWCMSPGGGPLRAALSGGGSWGEGHHPHVSERFGHSAHWGLVCEDMPHTSNRVELSAIMTDRCGLRAPRIVYRIDANSRALAEWHSARARESLEEAGAWHTELEALFPANGHFTGTARMGDDPRTSVVDRWSMCHDVPNLGIIDGSVFVMAWRRRSRAISLCPTTTRNWLPWPMSSGFLWAGRGHLVVLVQDPVHGRDRGEIGPLVEQFGVNRGRGLVDELIGLVFS